MYLARFLLPCFLLCVLLATGLSACGGKLLAVKGARYVVKHISSDEAEVTYNSSSSFILVGLRTMTKPPSPQALEFNQITVPPGQRCLSPIENFELPFKSSTDKTKYVLREIMPGAYTIGSLASGSARTFTAVAGHVYYLGDYALTIGPGAAPLITVGQDRAAALHELEKQDFTVSPEMPSLQPVTYPVCAL